MIERDVECVRAFNNTLLGGVGYRDRSARNHALLLRSYTFIKFSSSTSSTGAQPQFVRV